MPPAVYASPSSRLAALPRERAYLTPGPGGLPTSSLFEQSLSNCHVRVSGVVYNQVIFELFNTPINGSESLLLGDGLDHVHLADRPAQPRNRRQVSRLLRSTARVLGRGCA